MTFYPEPLPPATAPVEIYSPSGRVIGWTNDGWTADMFQRSGYIAV